MFIPEGVKVLFLDDDPTRHDLFLQSMCGRVEVIQAWGFFEAVKFLKEHKPHTVFLDHDLGDHREPDRIASMYGGRGSELTGEDVARYIFNNEEVHPTQCVVHSHNPDGAKNIAAWMQKVCPVEVVQFGQMFTNLRVR